MRTRIVDLALIASLVVVAGGIMWTLFNLGGTPRPPTPPTTAAPTDPAPGQQALPSPPSGSGVIVVDPNDPTAPGTAIVPVAPDAPDATGPAPATPATPAPDAAETAAADPAEPPPTDPGRTLPAAAAAPVPSGTVGLERVGFSYVTGGAGACGVVLEPWQHVAVSRELLEAYGCGARVTLTLDDPAGDRESFTAVVADTMNPQFSRTANVYVGTDEDAFAYGLTAGSITPLE